MSIWRLILRSLWHHRRINLAVACGVAAATAVLTGALLVGSSMRHSLKNLTLDRLGRIEEIAITSHFFREELADELLSGEHQARLAEHYDFAVATAVFPQGTVEHTITVTDDDKPKKQATVDDKPKQQTLRAANVLVVGSREKFWKLAAESAASVPLPGPEEVVLNETLAAELKVKEGDSITLRLPNTDVQVNPDNPLADREDRISSLPRLTVKAVIPLEGLGRFSLRPSQSAPRNLFVHLDTLREALNVEGKANAIFVAGKDGQVASAEVSDLLAESLRPTLEDYGLLAKPVAQQFTPKGEEEPQTAFRYISISSVQMVFSDQLAQSLQKTLQPLQAQPVSTYLANALYKTPPETDDQKPSENIVPYSMITGISSNAQLGPLISGDGKPISVAKDEIVLIDWAAERMKVKVGDSVRLAYFEPETTHGETVERYRDFKLKAIVPTVKPALAYTARLDAKFVTRPTRANDPNLTPEVPGVTDRESMEDWDLPFKQTWSVDGPDDEFWRFHRTTPKAYVAMETAEELWGSRFGTLTSFRIPYENDTELADIKAAITKAVYENEEAHGFRFNALKRNGLKAASGTTPFDVLFLALSFFIITAALMLVSLLFRLGIEQRAPEIGALLAVGMSRKRTALALILEGWAVAECGGLLGIIVGIGYAQLMIYGLNNWWVGAVVTSFLEFHWSIVSLIIGFVAGVSVSVLTIAWSVRQTRKLSVRQLMSGQGRQHAQGSYRELRWATWFGYGLLMSAIGLTFYATKLGGEKQAGAFVGGGAALLIGILMLIWVRLRGGTFRQALSVKLSLPRLAVSSAGRNPGRSTTTIGLMAFACFLIVSMSSFQLSPTQQGKGGFDLIAESSQPITSDLNDLRFRRDMWGTKADELALARIFSFRVRAGDDASCNNLYKASQPRVLGVTKDFATHFDQNAVTTFEFAKSSATTPSEINNPWHVLWQDKDEEDDGAVPVILDKNTAMYGLQLYKGVGQRFKFTYDDGQEITFRVAGFLKNSTLQGSLLVSEEQFTRLFRNTAGYRFFLIQSAFLRADMTLDRNASMTMTRRLENSLGDYGFDTYSSSELLEQLLAVQNTYLSTFQSLGALGLLLGTFGLATVQIRNVVERRRELAMMRAQGFAVNRISKLVLFENLVLLLGGLAAGIVAALIAVLPHMIVGGASIPLVALVVMIGVVLTAGIGAAMFATARTSRAPLLSALRGD